METTKKVYDFAFDQVRDQVAQALRRHKNSGTIADVVGLSGVPKYQVETVMPAVVAECRGQMAVTESGEILYRFPLGLVNAEKSFGKRFLRGLGKVLAALFKGWIMVMLVGYFVLFVVILLLVLLVSFAMSFMRNSDDREGAEVGGLMGGLVVNRVLEMFLLLWLFSGDSEYQVQKKKRPFHRAIFEFVFGVEEQPAVRAKMERKAFVSLVRRSRGTVSLEEVMGITGKSRAEADGFISRMMLEFEGEPRVTEAGTLNFFFPGLLKTSGDVDRPYILPEQELIPFSRNPSKTNRWIVFLNGFNVVLGIYFLAFGLQGFQAVQSGGDHLSLLYLITVAVGSVLGHVSLTVSNYWVTIVLGGIPTVYSALFFGIPLVRRWTEGKKNQKIKKDNFRRKLIAAVTAKPTDIRLDLVEPDHPRNAPRKPGTERESLKENLLRDLAGDRPVDVQGTKPTVYSIPELEAEARDLAQVRKNTDLSQWAIGKVVFDTEDRIE